MDEEGWVGGGDFWGDFSGIKRAVSNEPLPNLLAMACANGSRLSV